MTDIRLTLGPVTFADFEVPERVQFGGSQRLAVHQLPGGTRVVDAMGRDDADLRWGGVFTGAGAADRVRLLDELRAAGATLPLSWDAFYYTVVIARLDADYTSPWWIPYRLVCKVVEDQSAALVSVVATVAASVASDLAVASGFTDVSAAQVALAASGATLRGTGGYAGALTSMQSTASGIDAQITAAGSGLQSSDLPTAMASAGQLAQLSAARGYVGRAATNLADAST